MLYLQQQLQLAYSSPTTPSNVTLGSGAERANASMSAALDAVTMAYYLVGIVIAVVVGVVSVMAYVHKIVKGLPSKKDKEKIESDIKNTKSQHYALKERAALIEKDIKNLQDDVKDLKNQVKELDAKRRGNIYARRIIDKYKETGVLEEDE